MASRDPDVASFADDFPSLKAKWVVMQRAPRRSSHPFEDLAFVPDHDLLDGAWLDAATDTNGAAAAAKPLPVCASGDPSEACAAARVSPCALRDGELDNPAGASQPDLLDALDPAACAAHGAAALFRDAEDEMESWLQYSVEGSAAAAAEIKPADAGDAAGKPSCSARAAVPADGSGGSSSGQARSSVLTGSGSSSGQPATQSAHAARMDPPSTPSAAASPAPNRNGGASQDVSRNGDDGAGRETAPQACGGGGGMEAADGTKSIGRVEAGSGEGHGRKNSGMTAPISPHLLPPPSPKEPPQQSAGKAPLRQLAQLPDARNLPQPPPAFTASVKRSSPPLNFSHFSRPAALYSRAHAKGLVSCARGSAMPRASSAAGDAVQRTVSGTMLPPPKSPPSAVPRRAGEGAASAQAAEGATAAAAPESRWCGRVVAGSSEGGRMVGSVGGRLAAGGAGSARDVLAERKCSNGASQTVSAGARASVGNGGAAEANRMMAACQRLPYAPLAASMAASAERQRVGQSFSATAGGAGSGALRRPGAGLRCSSVDTGVLGGMGRGSIAASAGAEEADKTWPGGAEGGMGTRSGEERAARAVREMKERSAWTSNTWGSRDESWARGSSRKRKAGDGSECGKSEDMREESADTRRTGGAGEGGGAGLRSAGGAMSLSGRDDDEGSAAKRARAAHVHNLSERRRRDRINERMKALQELIPNSNKSDKASVLDEAIEYLKMLQLQLHVMSLRTGISIPPALAPTPAALSSLAASPSLSASSPISLTAAAAQIAAPPTSLSRPLPSSLPASASTAAAGVVLSGSAAAAAAAAASSLPSPTSMGLGSGGLDLSALGMGMGVGMGMGMGMGMDGGGGGGMGLNMALGEIGSLSAQQRLLMEMTCGSAGEAAAGQEQLRLLQQKLQQLQQLEQLQQLQQLQHQQRQQQQELQQELRAREENAAAAAAAAAAGSILSPTTPTTPSTAAGGVASAGAAFPGTSSGSACGGTASVRSNSRQAHLLLQLQAMQALAAATTGSGGCSNGARGEGAAVEEEVKPPANVTRLMPGGGGGFSGRDMAGILGLGVGEAGAGGGEGGRVAVSDAVEAFHIRQQVQMQQRLMLLRKKQEMENSLQQEQQQQQQQKQQEQQQAFNIELYQAILAQQQCQQRVSEMI